MSPQVSSWCRTAVAVVAALAIGAPVAGASPTPTPTTTPTPAPAPASSGAPSSSTPATDSQGFVDSSARCTAPQVAVAYGSTANSKVAICEIAAGKFEYHGVRLRDGAKLVAAATPNSSGGFVAQSDGSTYTLTAKALEITDASGQVRSEPVTYFRGSNTAPASTSGGAAPSTGSGGTPSTSGSGAPVTPVTGAPTAAPTTPLPPPLPAEVGGGKTAPRQ